MQQITDWAKLYHQIIWLRFIWKIGLGECQYFGCIRLVMKCDTPLHGPILFGRPDLHIIHAPSEGDPLVVLVVGDVDVLQTDVDKLLRYVVHKWYSNTRHADLHRKGDSCKCTVSKTTGLKRIQFNSKQDMSTARWRLKSPGHCLVHPPTPPWLSKGHGHGHEWSTRIPFIPCQSALPFLK